MGGLQDRISLHLRDDADRHSGADRLPAHRRLFLQGRDHRGGLSPARTRWRSTPSCCTVIAALLTAFYSWRLIFMTFHGEPHDRHHWRDAHESPPVMLIPLAVLALGAVLAGFAVHRHIFIGDGVEGFFRDIAHVRRRQHDPRAHARGAAADRHPADRDDGWSASPSPGTSTSAIPTCRSSSRASTTVLYQFLLNKWYFDELYDPSSCGRPSGSAASCGRAATAR